MEAVIRVNADEFDEKLFQQIKGLLGINKNLEVTISIGEPSTGVHRHETKQEYFDRLLKAKENLNNNTNVVTYKVGEFGEFEKFLLNEQ